LPFLEFSTQPTFVGTTKFYQSFADANLFPKSELELPMVSSPKVRDVSTISVSRDRMLEYGVSAISSAELISVLMGLSKDKATELLGGFGDLDVNTKAELRQISQEELQHRWKISDAKAAILLAALELGRRVFLPCTQKGAIIDCLESIVAAFPELQTATVEHFGVILLDVKLRMIAKRIISIGTLDETIAHPREVFRDAVKYSAAGLVVVHNHPSGKTDPSQEDLNLTRQLLATGRILQIPVYDHVIIGHGEFTSLKRSTSIWEEPRRTHEY
jgi:DNA repair protein RadC